ncbi:MAG: GGDEF domain-containing protein [Cytophagales bacterium]|nr:GGDEF domain-containing protein [Rhizobacter sp.]
MSQLTLATGQPAADDAAAQKARSAQQKKAAHMVRNIYLMAVSYLIDGVVLALFYLAGTISWVPVVAYTASSLALSATIAWLIGSGRTQRFKDPGIIIGQTIPAQMIQLGSMYFFPEVGFMFALLLFIVYSSLTMRLEVRQSLIAWGIVSVCTAIVLGLSGQPLRIPDSSLTEQLISMAFFALTLWRCVWLGAYNTGMTALLKKRGTELAALTAKVDQLAHHDELTGLLNRRSLLTALREELQRADRQKTPLCLGVLDLDKFKSVNDTLGHLAGDKTLKIFSSTLASLTRKTDRFGRYGGEEFLLIMIDTSAETALIPVERMRETLRDAPWSEVAPNFSATFSCGIACYQPGESLEALIQRADQALYRAKADGRNCTRLG